MQQADILLIDDTPENLRLLSRMLEAKGYQVRKTISGKLGLRAAYRQPPDLILLDVNMPEMDGYAICGHLQKHSRTRDIPVIFISALDDLSSKLRAFEVGGVDYVTKPFQEAEVLQRICHQLTIVQQRRQLQAQNLQLQVEIQERQRAEAAVQHLNTHLERQVHLRTLELEQALHFESVLKCITDKMQGSVEQEQILHVAVNELTRSLELSCCAAILNEGSLFLLSCCCSSIDILPETIQQAIHQFQQWPEIQQQLIGQMPYFAFCPVPTATDLPPMAFLVCPILGEGRIIGHLWLLKAQLSSFGDLEVQLAQQVAIQCEIALRLASLYKIAQQQVRELAKLNHMKDDFLNTISHELRTPMANIKMAHYMLETLLRRKNVSTQEDTPIGRYLKILNEECQRETRLIEDLLSITHLNAGSEPLLKSVIQVDRWLARVVEPFQSTAAAQGQTLQVMIPEEVPLLETDEMLLTRLVSELLQNACKYTVTGGKIKVVVEIVLNRSTKAKALLRLSVCNSAAIAPEEMPHIFDTFYRIPNDNPWYYRGTGFGLALAQRIANYIGGHLQVSSGENQTCFILDLALQ